MMNHDHEAEHASRHPKNVWARGVIIPAGGGVVGRGRSVRVLAMTTDPEEEPKTYALNLSPNLDPALALPLYDVRVGIGEESYEWLNLPAPAAGSVYVVQAHSFTVDVREGNVGAGTRIFGFAGPTEAVPTLTP